MMREYVKLKNFEREIKWSFMIYADFESILLPEDNGKQSPNESYTNKYQKDIACSYVYKLVYVDDKFSKPFKSFLDKDAIYNFIKSMIEESKYTVKYVFEKFRNSSVMNYGLCSSHYSRAPALSWDIMLNMTKVEAELIPDPDMYIFFGKGTGGEISYISNRYRKPTINI